MPRCKICKERFEAVYFLQKTCSIECSKKYTPIKGLDSNVVVKTEIKPKEKPCKGTGKAKGYGCGKLTLERQYGLGVHCCYRDWLFTSEQGKEKMERNKINHISDKEGFDIRVIEKVKSHQDLLSEVRELCHRFIKLRDLGLPCISCNKPWSEEFHAGHYFKAELYSGLRFNELNINGQCPECNILEDGNFKGYTIGIHNKLTTPDFHSLISMSEIKYYKWAPEQLLELKNYFKQKINKFR